MDYVVILTTKNPLSCPEEVMVQRLVSIQPKQVNKHNYFSCAKNPKKIDVIPVNFSLFHSFVTPLAQILEGFIETRFLTSWRGSVRLVFSPLGRVQ